MIDVVADLHLHSRYSRAVSPQMIPPVMAQFGKAKGIDLLATGDWTHPLWFREIRSQLIESEEGLFKFKNSYQPSPQTLSQEERENKDKAVRFLLSVEIACIYTQGGKGRRIHNVVFAPSFETAEKVNKALMQRGFNLSSDGRPILGLSSKNLLQLLLEIDERCLLIPAHVWTPWFGIYGQMSGFNSLSEAFEDLAPFIYGIETGLSSDPEMNWQIEELSTRSILSFSDAHSAAKMGREATVFRLEELSYENIRKAIMEPSQKTQNTQTVRKSDVQGVRISDSPSFLSIPNKVLYTIEFYPEEGKYHYSGHRNCNVTMTPKEQKEAHSICPVCKRPVTDGVMRRVQELAEEDLRGEHKPNHQGLVWISDPKHQRPPFVRLVPILEIIAESLKVPVGSPKAKVVFDGLTSGLDSELNILLKVPVEEITKVVSGVTTNENAQKVAEGVEKVRKAQIVIKPGYDGVYGVVKIWNEGKDVAKDVDEPEKDSKSQIGLEF